MVQEQFLHRPHDKCQMFLMKWVGTLQCELILILSELNFDEARSYFIMVVELCR